MSDDCLHNTGIVSTAFIADATPAAMTAHTADRGQYPHVVDTYLNGITNVRQSHQTYLDGASSETVYSTLGQIGLALMFFSVVGRSNSFPARLHTKDKTTTNCSRIRDTTS